jgi:SAM-dependent methyltransferase
VPGYGPDLTYVHDQSFTDLAQLAADATLALVGSESRGPILELGCGGGVTAGALIDAGLYVRGIDISPAQIRLARARVPEGEFEVGSIHDADFGEGNAAIVAVGEVLNYAFDPRTSPDDLDALFTRAHAALVPGGVLLFDSAGPGRVPGGGPARGFREGPDWAVLHEAVEKTDPPEVVREITTFRLEEDECWRRSHECHALALHDPGRLLRILGEAGFEATRREGYDDVLLAPALDVFVARRPERGSGGGR